MITIIAFLILLGVLVVIHEGGHFFVLRMCKVHVDRFSVGMGPVIYTKKDKGYGCRSIKASTDGESINKQRPRQ